MSEDGASEARPGEGWPAAHASLAAGAAQAGTRTDWGARIRARLAGSRPLHQRDQWLFCGLGRERSRALHDLFPADPMPAAVLVPLIERDGALTVLLTQRATRLTHHAGQISFPGGRIEPQDRDPRAAALREAQEEVGLAPEDVSVAGYLPDHIMISSGYRVTPVVGFVRPGFAPRLSAPEVQASFEVPIEYIFDPVHHRPRVRRVGPRGAQVQVCDIPYGERDIWGATAGMLITLYQLCAQDAP